MLTRRQMLDITKRQLARDIGCDPGLFEQHSVAVTRHAAEEGHRIYENEEDFLRIAAYLSGAVVSSDNEEMFNWCQNYFDSFAHEWIFDAPALRDIQTRLQVFGYQTASLRLFYLPLGQSYAEMPPPETTLRWFEADELHIFRGDKRFGHALMFQPNAPDMLAVAAYEDGGITAMAGISADSATLWQIGVDVLPEHRGKGLGSMLVSQLRDEVLQRDKIPFYGTAPSHTSSQLVASRAGFVPTWSQLSVMKTPK